MKDRLQRFRGMGACPHVSEAQLYPNEDARPRTMPFACTLLPYRKSTSRHDKQMAVLQVQA